MSVRIWFVVADLPVGIVIQARLDSKRFPKKVLEDIEQKPMIWHIIERCKRVKDSEKVILAISNSERDDPLLTIARKCEVHCYRGSASDVLDRYYKCAKEFRLDPIVRITGDCPLIDIETANKIIRTYLASHFDYVRTGLSYPDGLNVEVFSMKSLEIASNEATHFSEREHVTPYIWKNPSKFTLHHVEFQTDMSNYRLTVDYKEDLVFINKIYNRLFSKDNFFGFMDVLRLLKNDVDLLKSMPTPKRYEGYYLSLKHDKEQQS